MGITGYVNSIQTLGTLDGPGVRFVVFFQGCCLRCGVCHNPDTWSISGGTEYSAEIIAKKAESYRAYFGKEGGITISGGEPLLQAEFAEEIFRLCRQKGMNTCLDTSGCVMNDNVRALLQQTDRVLLDIKYTSDELYRKYVGCEIDKPLNFLSYLDGKKIPVTLRQVIVPGLNDSEQNIAALAKIIKQYPCIDSTELLPFKKICKAKYDNLGLDFEFEKYPTPTKQEMETLEKMLKQMCK